jgi:Domain of unknown function (DUF4124)
MPRFVKRLAMMRYLCAMAWCMPLLLAMPAAADICKYADRDGNLHYTNVAPERGWKKISCGVGGTAGPGETETRSAPSPGSFPKVDAGTQKGRDELRRKVLTEELTTEEKLLDEARIAYGNGSPPPTPEELNQPQKYAERLARLRQAVSLHEKNIEALKKELAATR